MCVHACVCIQQEMGLILKGHSRIQINLIMRRTKYNYKTAPFNNMILPLFWTEMVSCQLL